MVSGRVMKAILLAAGAGRRLMPYTKSTPKHLLSLGSTTIIHRTVDILRNLGIEDISIVVGHLKEKYYEAFPKGIRFYTNEDYETTDQAASLLRAAEKLEGNFLVIAGDLFCPRKVYTEILNHPDSVCLAIEKRGKRFDDVTEKVLVRGERILKIGKLNVSNEEANGEFFGLTKVRGERAGFFLQNLQASLLESPKSAIIHVHQRMIQKGQPISYVHCGDPWYEIDELPTWERAKSIFQEIPNY